MVNTHEWRVIDLLTQGHDVCCHGARFETLKKHNDYLYGRGARGGEGGRGGGEGRRHRCTVCRGSRLIIIACVDKHCFVSSVWCGLYYTQYLCRGYYRTSTVQNTRKETNHFSVMVIGSTVPNDSSSSKDSRPPPLETNELGNDSHKEGTFNY
jgi:hypothetical protein